MLWSDLLVNQLTDEEKEDLKEAGNRRKYKWLGIPNIIGGRVLCKTTILNYLNYENFVGDCDKKIPINFVAVDIDMFEDDGNREWFVKHWDKLGGVAIVQWVRKHFVSVFFSPLRENTPIFGYDSRRFWGGSDPVDLSGEKCSTIDVGCSNTTTVRPTKRQKKKRDREQERIKLLADLIKRVSITERKIKRESASSGMKKYYEKKDEKDEGWDERGWEIIRTFVSQVDDTSCGVLTCLFLECMIKGYQVRGVKVEIETAALEEYRWGIAKKCYEMRIKDHAGCRRIGGLKIVDGVDLIDI